MKRKGQVMFEYLVLIAVTLSMFALIQAIFIKAWKSAFLNLSQTWQESAETK